MWDREISGATVKDEPASTVEYSAKDYVTTAAGVLTENGFFLDEKTKQDKPQASTTVKSIQSGSQLAHTSENQFQQQHQIQQQASTSQ